MLIVFLDFDGVINYGAGPWERALVEQLNRITDQTGAKIVVHSSWRWSRSLDMLRDVLREHHKGVPVTGEVIDACKPPGKLLAPRGTPLASRRDRPLAIQTWLDEHPGQVKRFVILDDAPDLGHFVGTPEFIRTDDGGDGTLSIAGVGLTKERADRAILHLKGVGW